MTGTAGQQRIYQEFFANYFIGLAPVANQLLIIEMLEAAKSGGDATRDLAMRHSSSIDELMLRWRPHRTGIKSGLSRASSSQVSGVLAVRDELLGATRA